MKFYRVSEKHIAYLKSIDSKVPDNYGNKRAYVGVLLEINGVKYVAPLTSYKPKQDTFDTSKPTIFKIHERTDPTNKLGMVQLNNMVPVIDSVISEVLFENEPSPYREMLIKQYEFIKQNKAILLEKASKLYQLVAVKNNEFYKRISCDFVALESAVIEYEKSMADK